MAQLKKEYKKMRLFLPDGKELNLEAATQQELTALSKKKGYEHLFETNKK